MSGGFSLVYVRLLSLDLFPLPKVLEKACVCAFVCARVCAWSVFVHPSANEL
jgi:hypothetical protein